MKRALILLALTLLVAACTVTRQQDAEVGALPTSAPEQIVVCRMVSPQISGSLIPLGGNRALTAGHVYQQPVTEIDGKRTGLTRLTADFSRDVSERDMVQLQVNDIPLPAPNRLRPGFAFEEGTVIYIAGFVTKPSSHVRKTTAGHSYVEARVISPPFWADKSEGLVFVSVLGNPDLSGASGGPASVWDSETGWNTVGIYLGTWQWGISEVYVIRALPEGITETAP